ncbi:MAG: hypothetical protein WCX73_01005 [Candidatus Pacearchaeota archaeon]|jgi:hypothetical protein
MSWFKKKEKQIENEEMPELPELPSPDEFSLPELPKSNNSFLAKLQKPGFNAESYNSQLPELPELKKENNFHPTVIRQEKINPNQAMQRSQFEKIENKQRQEAIQMNKPIEIEETISRPNKSSRGTEPVYVRLDKFETSLQSIEEIKKKISEVEEILRKTKEIKQKEEQELELWEKEINIIKSRIDSIDKTIFNKFD